MTLEILVSHSYELMGLVLLLGCSAFFSGSETALFSLTRQDLRRLERSQSRSARLILTMLRDPDRLLSAILVGNMLVNVTFYSVSFLIAAKLYDEVSHPAAAVAGAASLLAVIVFGEVSPKGIAVGHPQRFSRYVAPVIYVIYLAARPLGTALRKLSRGFTGFLASRFRRMPYVTRDELKMLVGMAEQQGVLDRETRGMIQQVVELANISVNGAMTPRVDMVLFDLAAGLDAFCNLVRKTHEERIAAYEGSRDNIVGVLVAREVFLHPEQDLRSMLRPVRFVPETQTVESLLRQFRKTKEPFAIVVDEYGGTAGLVTLEHILEEVVGQIRDEFEAKETPVQQLDEDTYLLDGDLNTHEWRQFLGVGFDPPGIETLAGFVVSLLGRIPKEGDSVEWRGLRFIVEKMSGRRVVLVRVERKLDEEED